MEDILGVMVPLSAVILGLGLAMIVVVTKHRRQAQALEQRHRERMAAIEKGIELPPDRLDEALLESRPERPASRYLLRGLVFTGVGIALLLRWTATGGSIASSVGWILLGIGVAQLIYYAVEGRKQATHDASPRPGDLAPPRS